MLELINILVKGVRAEEVHLRGGQRSDVPWGLTHRRWQEAQVDIEQTPQGDLVEVGRGIVTAVQIIAVAANISDLEDRMPGQRLVNRHIVFQVKRANRIC